MEKTVNYMSILEDILVSQISTLNLLFSCQKRMYEAVLTRNWVLLQQENSEKDHLLEEFTRFEKNRVSLMDTLNPSGSASADFYQVTAAFPPARRDCVNSYFREIKRLLVLVKTENDVLSTYTENAKTVLQGMFDAIMPAGKSRIYSNRGNLVSGAVESLVLNQTL